VAARSPNEWQGKERQSKSKKSTADFFITPKYLQNK
jgi:hypothetical protein